MIVDVKEESSLTKIKDVEPGECFISDGDLYIMTDVTSSDMYNLSVARGKEIVNLETGCIDVGFLEEEVQVIKAKVVLE